MSSLVAGATCPKCGAPRAKEAADCPRCGVVYARAEAARARADDAAIPFEPPMPEDVSATDAAALLEPSSAMRSLVLWRRYGAIVSIVFALFLGKLLAGQQGVASFVAGQMLVAGFMLFLAHAFARRAPWSRIGAIVVACIELLAFPFGTVLGVLTIHYLTRPGAALMFAEMPLSGMTRGQRDALLDFRGSQAGVWIRRLVIAGIALATVALLVLGAIVATVADRYSGTAVAYQQVAQIEDVVTNYATSLGHYPDTQPIESLNAAISGGGAPVLPATDPWGHPYRYERQEGGVRVGSAGPDGRWALPRLADYPASTSCDDIVWDGRQYVGSR